MREENTTVGITAVTRGGNRNNAVSIDIEQVWSDLSDEDSWEYEPYFYYNSPSGVTLKLSYTRNGTAVPIDNHQLDFVTTQIGGYVWNDLAGEDEDEDGWPDGEYEPVTYTDDELDAWIFSGSQLYNFAPNDLVEWSPTSQVNGAGRYTSQQTVWIDDTLLIDYVGFDAVDHNAFDEEGDN